MSEQTCAEPELNGTRPAQSLTKQALTEQTLTEQILDWSREGVQIDRGERLVRNVALAGRYSRNGYEYESQALLEAVDLYEGKPVFLDHAGRSGHVRERSARDLIGSVENVSYQDERVRGDIRVLDTESGRTFLALAESESDVVGMSHVVLAERTADRSRVVKIHDVISVDVVVSPATTRGLKEGMDEMPLGIRLGMTLMGSYEMVLQQLDDQLEEHVGEVSANAYRNVERVGLFNENMIALAEREGVEVGLVFAWSYKDGVTGLANQIVEVEVEEIELGTWMDREDLPSLKNESDESTAGQMVLGQKWLSEEVERLRIECESLTNELNQARAENDCQLQVAEWMQQMEQMGMPAEAVTDLFREQLVATTDGTRRDELIRERLELWKRARRQLPRSSGRLSETGEEQNQDEEFIRLLKAA
ncbi:hypothetical protein Pla110_06780 [Polystyrenella longa]|uniref:Uncharacterized protein n=1 Tax=Polystyrenella longa TaxID=2528007 RepID=A0A518CIG9_9PLAN|nr:hypothetical protein [Polystyrenella longa]QDU78974.1 hypothetical protein Pla110_06780 [Polystyrenella longa]